MNKVLCGILAVSCLVGLSCSAAYATTPREDTGEQYSASVSPAQAENDLPGPVENDSADTVPLAAIKVDNGHEYITTVDAATAAETEELVIEGNPGDLFVSGDLIFEIISPEEMDAVLSSFDKSRASMKMWTAPLSRDSMSRSIPVTSQYPYAKVWISNQGPANIQFTITKDSPTGSVVSGSMVTVVPGASVSVYSTVKWPAAAYFANYTCGKADMSGTTACRIASTIFELDI